MFREEAEWIRKILASLPLDGLALANLGSSTKEFRQNVQPHIQEEVIAPLEMRGARWTHIDAKNGDGIDIIADISSSEFPIQINNQYDLVLCTNMLEHVEDIEKVIYNIWSIARPGGYLLVTVPLRYPLHYDPIDNGFRPTPDELASLFLKNFTGSIIRKNKITIRDIDYYPVKRSRFPIWGYRVRLRYWLGYYYLTSGVLIKKDV